MDLTFRAHYWDDSRARAAFKKFILEIHGLDFSEWERCGYWDDAYTPFSFFQGGEVVASVCVYLLEATIKGRSTHLAQISGVGTLPNWRRQGLNRRLTEIGLEWASGRHEGVFLFADTGAQSFYRRCGFAPIAEFVEIAEATATARCGKIVRLDPARRHDRDRIYQYAKNRTPVSDRFGVTNARLLMFHVLYTLRDCVYEIPDLNCLVLFRRDHGCVRLYDVVTPSCPRLEDLYAYIADEGDRIIEMHFHSDKLGLKAPHKKLITGNNPHVRGSFPFHKPVFPYTSRA